MPERERELARIDERSYHSSAPRAPTHVSIPNHIPSSSPHSHAASRPRTIVPEPERDARPRTIVPEPIYSVPHLEERDRDISPGRESHVSKRSHKSSHTHRSRHEREDRERERERERDDRDKDTWERDESYTSARSHHTHYSASTVKPFPDKPAVPNPPSAISSSGRRRKSSHPKEEYSSSPSKSHYSSSPTKVREREREGERARDVPLPMSVAGHSEWERGSVRLVPGLGREYNEYVADGLREELAGFGKRGGGLAANLEVDGYGSGGGGGYAASVAPSDSISSVGMKKDRERLRERMGRRERV